MSTFNLGRILPVLKGNWESSYNYFPLDVVLYLGSSYVAKSRIMAGGNNPANNNDWQLIAASGELSGNITPEQQQAIINSIIVQGGFVVDNNYTHTDNNFTDSYKNAVDNIGDGLINIYRNGESIGNFSVNQRTNQSINISVPTSLSELTGVLNLVNYQESILIEGSPTGIIDVLKENTIYYFDGPLDDLVIDNFNLVDPLDYNTWIYPETNIYVTTGSNEMTFSFPSGTRLVDNNTFDADSDYKITFKGAIVSIKKLI